jgi:putative serine protease PepD
MTAQNQADALGLSLEDRPSGVYVRFVAPGSSADVAGIHQGDRIVAIGSNHVTSTSDVRTILGMTPAGTPIPVSLERDGRPFTASIKPPNAP